MLDLMTLAVNDTSVLHLKGPNNVLLYAPVAEGGAPEPVTVTLYGPGSEQFQAAMEAQQDQQLDQAKAQGEARLTAAQMKSQQTETLIAVTASFSPNVTFGPAGADAQTLARAIYANPKLGYIREQVSRRLGDWSAFLPASTGS